MTNPITDDRRARIYLLRAAEPPAPAVHAFVTAHGPVTAVERIRAGAAPPAVLAEIVRPDPRLDLDLDALDTGAAALLTPEDPDWPHGLLAGLSQVGVGAPLGLWIRGRTPLAALTPATVSIVGARSSTSYGETVAADFAYDLTRAGVTVISGGSHGVDGSAHRGAVAADGPTIAVLPSGVDMAFPMSHSGLFDQIVQAGGLLISEYPIGAIATRARIVARGRLLAALGAANVVVEAASRSGALAVARVGRVLGRRVYAVPGPITSTQSAGTNELLRTGEARAISAVAQIEYGSGIR
ncbi:DNA-processing protein DprA [Actinokineospora sp. NBRC 105648]|uniref:DNA-processing protein DprA n=1 Tax=Actinokineospora sp. NBRC 105648 TaxID=3032206 RepID=UPI0024A28A45|nr:DNA-processing protein DprA [Actinokineospora sp. NBRC 105648]GLZ37867.1 hypothetical protein Acsp05_14910 [Actinokineospora sp. NBRC 105648]